MLLNLNPTKFYFWFFTAETHKTKFQVSDEPQRGFPMSTRPSGGLPEASRFAKGVLTLLVLREECSFITHILCWGLLGMFSK
jgi:hypothetical protein